MTLTQNKNLIVQFVENIWNQNDFETLNQLVDINFIDHSLPPNETGLKLWIISTGKSFEHKTIIDEIVCENNKVIIKIKMQMKHIGVWRAIEPTGAEIQTIGYRYFKIANDRIIEHWALIDGNAIENQLKEATHGCKIQI